MVNMVIHGRVPVLSLFRAGFHSKPLPFLEQVAKTATRRLEKKRVKLYAMAHSAKEAEKAVHDGAEGIGLARTEIMYAGPERSAWLLKALQSRPGLERDQALQNLQNATRDEVAGMLKVLKGKPLTIRLLDPSLSEILPQAQFHENNPLLGLRGVRLGIIRPEIYEMQIRGILAGAAQAIKDRTKVNLGILIPNVSAAGELKSMRQTFLMIREKVEQAEKVKIPCKLGTMLETPRACVLADKLAPYVDFFTIGSNDLTQSTWALSREDSEGKFLTSYLNQGIIPQDPFQHLDADGVGLLMKEGIEKGKSANPDLEIVLAGDAASDPATAKLLRRLGVDAVASNVKSLRAVKQALLEA